MRDGTAPYDVTVMGKVYQVARENDEGGVRIGISSRGTLRFSLPVDTPHEQVGRFIQVYALGFADGQTARSAALQDHIRGRLQLAAQRLGMAVGKLKSGA